MYLYEKWLKETGQGIYADYITDTSSKTYTPRYTDEEIATAQTTDWLDEVTRTGMQQSHNVSLTGGSEKTQYAASLNYFTQKGVVKNNAMDRFTMKVNLDQELSKYIKTGFSLHLSRNQYDKVLFRQLCASTPVSPSVMKMAIIQSSRIWHNTPIRYRCSKLLIKQQATEFWLMAIYKQSQ